MTDLRTAITATLDTDGVHPWNDSWHDAYNLFFALVKEDTVEQAIYGSLDYLGVTDHEVKLRALANFWNAFNDTRRPSRGHAKKAARSVGKAVKAAGSKIHEAATAAPTS